MYVSWLVGREFIDGFCAVRREETLSEAVRVAVDGKMLRERCSGTLDGHCDQDRHAMYINRKEEAKC